MNKLPGRVRAVTSFREQDLEKNPLIINSHLHGIKIDMNVKKIEIF